MTRSRLWWVAFAVVQITVPTVTAWAAAWPATVQDVRTPPRPPKTVGEANIVRTRGYPFVWHFEHSYYDLSPAGEIIGEGRSDLACLGASTWYDTSPAGEIVGRGRSYRGQHRMLPVLLLLLSVALPGTLFTISRRHPAWPVRWVRVFFLTALTTLIVTMVDIASSGRDGICGWNEHYSALRPLLRKPAVKEALDWLAERREAYNVVPTHPLRCNEGLSAWCLVVSQVVFTIVYRPWRPRAEPGA